MITEEAVYLTPEGLEKLKEELNYLRNQKLVELEEQVRQLTADGDLSENTEYEFVKQEQAFIEQRIRDLEDSLRRARIIEDNGAGNTVRIGSTVTIVGVDGDEQEVYRIVGVPEAEPSQGLISDQSPMGRALLGAKKGETVVVQVPSGELRYTIKEIS